MKRKKWEVVYSESKIPSYLQQYWFEGLDTSTEEFRIALDKYTNEIISTQRCEKCWEDEIIKLRGKYKNEPKDDNYSELIQE